MRKVYQATALYGVDRFEAGPVAHLQGHRSRPRLLLEPVAVRPVFVLQRRFSWLSSRGSPSPRVSCSPRPHPPSALWKPCPIDLRFDRTTASAARGTSGGAFARWHFSLDCRPADRRTGRRSRFLGVHHGRPLVSRPPRHDLGRRGHPRAERGEVRHDCGCPNGPRTGGRGGRRRAAGARLGLPDPHLRDPGPHARSMAANAAGRFPEVVTRLLPGPEAALRGEPDEHARAALRSVVASAEPP